MAKNVAATRRKSHVTQLVIQARQFVVSRPLSSAEGHLALALGLPLQTVSKFSRIPSPRATRLKLIPDWLAAQPHRA